MIKREIQWFGRSCTLACDANCEKAWGVSNRPQIDFDPNDLDDSAFLSDGETGLAPDNPGTREGGHSKPRRAEDRLNKWCARECERSHIAEQSEEIKLPDFSARRFNQPWKHGQAV